MVSVVAVLGFNTKQWWVYDEDRGCYVDPPIEVLDSLSKYEYEEQGSKLEEIASAGV